MKIGIVGQGYVGTAVRTVFEKHYEVETWDKFVKEKSTCKYLGDLVDKSDVIFVCVPTPMNKDGSCDITSVQSVIYSISFHTADRKLIAVKSTIPPGTTTKLNKEYPQFDIVFNPEFLTEATFIEDFKNQNRIILGGIRRGTNKLRQVYSKVFPSTTIVKTGAKYAEMVKYFTNCFLATKVSFANEMKQICDGLDIDYDKVVEYATYDERLGKSHWAVPGPDGDFGFGGHCLPIDVSAIISEFDTLGLLESVKKVNDKVRKNRDWEQMKGRAVIDE
jgi:UDPglucose 6-dehydrogenase